MILFAGFLLAFFLSFTGVELHQCIGLIGGILAAYHLIVYWEWVDAVSKRIFEKASRNVKAKYVMDSALLVGFISIIVTGLVISTWLDISLSNYGDWLVIHILASVTTLLVLVVKLILHWRWISRTAKDSLTQPTPLFVKSVKQQPVLITRQSMDRRDFLKVMGMVRGGAFIALLSATKSLAALAGGSMDTVAQAATDDTTTITTTTTSSSGYSGISQHPSISFSTDGGCSIQCRKSCSYPGHCQRYTDADHNNRCDFGECSSIDE